MSIIGNGMNNGFSHNQNRLLPKIKEPLVKQEGITSSEVEDETETQTNSEDTQNPKIIDKTERKSGKLDELLEQNLDLMAQRAKTDMQIALHQLRPTGSIINTMKGVGGILPLTGAAGGDGTEGVDNTEPEPAPTQEGDGTQGGPKVTTTTNPDGSITEKTEMPDGTIIETTTNQNGTNYTTTTTTNPDGTKTIVQTEKGLDGEVRTTSVVVMNGENVVSRVEYEYDVEGNLLSTTTTTTDEDGNTIVTIVKADGETIVEKYDQDGNPVDDLTDEQLEQLKNASYSTIVVDEYGVRTETTYLADGTIIETITNPNGAGYTTTTTTSPDGTKTIVQTEKDEYGVERTTSEIVMKGDEVVSRTEYGYDENGNLVSITTTTTDEDGNTIVTTQDNRGITVEKYDPNGKLIPDVLEGTPEDNPDGGGILPFEDWVKDKTYDSQADAMIAYMLYANGGNGAGVGEVPDGLFDYDESHPIKDKDGNQIGMVYLKDGIQVGIDIQLPDGSREIRFNDGTTVRQEMYPDSDIVCIYKIENGEKVLVSATAADGTDKTEDVRIFEAGNVILEDLFNGNYGVGASFNREAFLNDMIACGFELLTFPYLNNNQMYDILKNAQERGYGWDRIIEILTDANEQARVGNYDNGNYGGTYGDPGFGLGDGGYDAVFGYGSYEEGYHLDFWGNWVPNTGVGGNGQGAWGGGTDNWGTGGGAGGSHY